MGFYPRTAPDETITVAQALQNPTVIEERVAEVASKNLLVDTLFTPGGEVAGGAVVYSQLTKKHLYTSDVAERAPGDEYPVVYADEPEPLLAKVRDYGGKFAVSDEAKRRNLSVDFDNSVTRLANTVARKINANAVATLEAAPVPTLANFTGGDWASLVVNGNATQNTDPREHPTALFAHAQAMADELELDITYSTLLLNPAERAHLRAAYGVELGAMLDAFDLTLVASNHVPAGTGYLVDPGKVGFIRYEEPLTVTTWRDEHHRQTWVQSFALPIMGVTMPDAAVKLAGLTIPTTEGE